jgi:hypothetical protein
MSFVPVLQVIGSLQLVSSCAVAVYTVAAWRRKGRARDPEPIWLRPRGAEARNEDGEAYSDSDIPQTAFYSLDT